MREDIDCGIINYECRICKTSFSRAKDAAYHEKKCGKCTCSICNKMFSSQLGLRKHTNVHEERHKCQTCNKAFGTNYILKRHMKVHSKEKEFPCSSCNSTFTLKANLRRHEKNCMNVM
jgi:uncharacterized Zn-finger protein